MRNAQHRTPAAVVAAAWLIWLTAPQAIAQPPVVEGQVGTLPGTPQANQRDQLLAGHVHLLARSIDQAIEDLEHAELKQFAKSYRRMVESYSLLADHIGDAAESIGDAEMQILLATRTLESAESLEAIDPERRRALSEDVGQIRAMLIGKLHAAKSRYDQAPENEKERLLENMNGLVQRIKQLGTLAGAVKEGARSILPGLAGGQLREQLDAIKELLDEEDKMLVVISNAVDSLVQGTTTEMRRTMRLLEVEAQLPTEQLASLSRTRQAVEQVLSQVTAAHQQAAHQAGRILLAPATDQPIGDPQALLDEVDRILKQQDE